MSFACRTADQGSLRRVHLLGDDAQSCRKAAADLGILFLVDCSHKDLRGTTSIDSIKIVQQVV